MLLNFCRTIPQFILTMNKQMTVIHVMYIRFWYLEKCLSNWPCKSCVDNKCTQNRHCYALFVYRRKSNRWINIKLIFLFIEKNDVKYQWNFSVIWLLCNRLWWLSGFFFWTTIDFNVWWNSFQNRHWNWHSFHWIRIVFRLLILTEFDELSAQMLKNEWAVNDNEQESDSKLLTN